MALNNPALINIQNITPMIPNSPMAWDVTNVNLPPGIPLQPGNLGNIINLQPGIQIPLQLGNIINIMNSKLYDLPNISILEAYLLINKNYFSPVSPDYLNNPLPQNNNEGDQTPPGTPPANNQQPEPDIVQHTNILNGILNNDDQIIVENQEIFPDIASVPYDDAQFQYNDEDNGFNNHIDGDDPSPGLNIGNINGHINGVRTLLIPFYDDSRLSYLNRMCKEFKEQLELQLYNSFLQLVGQFQDIAQQQIQQNNANPITYAFYNDNNQAVRDFYTNNRKTIITCIFLSFITDTPYYWGSTEFMNFNDVYNHFFSNLLSLIEFNAPSYTTLSFFYSTQENGTVIEKIEEFINNNNFNRIFLEEIIPSYLTELFHFSVQPLTINDQMYTLNHVPIPPLNHVPIQEMYVYRQLFCQLIYNYLYNNVFHGNNLIPNIPNYNTFIFEENSFVPPGYNINWIDQQQQLQLQLQQQLQQQQQQQQQLQQPQQQQLQQQPLQPPLNILQHIDSLNVTNRPVNRPLHTFVSPPPDTNDNRSPRDILFIRQPNDNGDNIPNEILITGSPISTALVDANIVKSPGYFEPQQNGVLPLVRGPTVLNIDNNNQIFQQQQYNQFRQMGVNNDIRINYFVAEYHNLNNLNEINFNAIDFNNFPIQSPQRFYLGYTVRYYNDNAIQNILQDLDDEDDEDNEDNGMDLVYAGKTRKHKRKYVIKKKTRKHKRKHTIKKKTRKHKRKHTIKKKTKKNSKV